MRVRARNSSSDEVPAFTLVELLVVMSLISILLSVTLPSFSRAREKARLTKCLGNLHQIGTATAAYFGESGDAFPWFADYEYQHNVRTNQSWFYGGRYPPVAVEPHKVSPELRFLPEQRPLNRYLYPRATGRRCGAPVYRCPSDSDVWWVSGSPANSEHDPRPAYLAVGTSYIANWWWPVRAGLYGHQSGTVLGRLPDYGNKLVRYKMGVAGATTFVMIYADPLDAMISGLRVGAGWHGEPRCCELLFLDGHAEYMSVLGGNASQWTLWFVGADASVPPMFMPPYPGIEWYAQ